MKLRRKLSQNYTIDDFFGMHDERLTNNAKIRVKNLKQFSGAQLKKSFNLFHPSEWIFLMLVGVCTTIICFGVDYISSLVLNYKYSLINDEERSFMGGYLIWV